ncbi:hypothetical protein F442_07767 [Phytophthora nicotianae P10297]|uniref:Uncharacterized protein n=1 Tax=Phytophthora nicotianae P10297 TaxID=1317064 RepID=W2ZFR9_PHYNI|nr:hypothetical protein F442_07767 [Phytophthora nicotianae P10297]
MSGMVGPLTKKGIDTKITQQPTRSAETTRFL